MSKVGIIKVLDDLHSGTILWCYDIEIADRFDDFLLTNLDKEIYFKFDDDCVAFYFGKEFSVSEVSELYMKFQKGIEIT